MWSADYPHYEERLEVMAEAVHWWLEYWYRAPDAEPTIGRKCPKPDTCASDQVCVFECYKG